MHAFVAIMHVTWTNSDVWDWNSVHGNLLLKGKVMLLRHPVYMPSGKLSTLSWVRVSIERIHPRAFRLPAVADRTDVARDSCLWYPSSYLSRIIGRHAYNDRRRNRHRERNHLLQYERILDAHLSLALLWMRMTRFDFRDSSRCRRFRNTHIHSSHTYTLHLKRNRVE